MDLLEKLKTGITTSSPEQTQSLAIKLTQALPHNPTLALYGQVGTGKTTFVKGLGKGWHITTPITSPSFNYFSIYKGDLNLVHLDAYRLEFPTDLEDFCLHDFLIQPYCLVIEWPENILLEHLENILTIEFTLQKENIHNIKLIN